MEVSSTLTAVLPQWLSLLAVSAAAGIGLLWVFRKTSDQEAIRRTKKRLQAHLLELRLYADDPLLVWRAQKHLLRHNLRYILLMLRPAVFATLPMVLLLVVLDGYYGKAPVPVGQAAIITLQMKAPLSPESSVPQLLAPPEISVETPAVRVLGARQISWRVRPRASVSDHLRFVDGGVTFTKSIEAGTGRRYISSRRVASVFPMLLHPGESLLEGDAVEWVEIEYPPASVGMLGLEMHWLVWFLVFSMTTALLLKGRFRVTI